MDMKKRRKNAGIKDEFYDNLGHTLNEFLLSRIRIDIKDFNAKLGKRRYLDQLSVTVAFMM